MDFTEKEIEVRNSVVNTNNSVNNTDVYNELMLRRLEEIAPQPAPSTYKVFTGLLTQSGGDDPQFLINTDNGNIIVGKTYEISNYDASDDFTNIGAPSNANGVKFIGTGTTATSWSGTTELNYNNAAPTVTILENTLGNVWFEYVNVGGYVFRSNGLLNENKSLYFAQNNNLNDLTYLFLTNGGAPNYIDITCSNILGQGTDNLMFKNPFEVRTYN